MKLVAILLTIFLSLNTFADTGMEKNTTPKKEKYLYNPINHMQTSVNLGITYFNLGSLSIAGNKSKPGIKLGIQAEVGQGLVFIVGLNYLMLKSENQSILSGVNDAEVQLDYLSLALGSKYYIAGSNTGFYIRGNIDPSLLINSSAKNTNVDFQDFDILASVGLGMVFGGATNFNIDLGYTMGLLDINKDIKTSTPIISSSQRNQGIALTLGLLF